HSHSKGILDLNNLSFHFLLPVLDLLPQFLPF
ncbi:unnamed protein product, partial [marine sediment metagenome]